jgi:poly-gamma-glutamate synthase PgsB/CapB
LVEILLSGALLSFLTIFYYIESRKISSIKKSIKIKIAVTGSRGKSTMVKFLCAVLTKAGYRVLGKVTGTTPMLILPDGEMQEIGRKGPVSILEQKKVLLKKAQEIKPDVLITEIMSINPEYQKVESKLLITPDYYLITNIKRDHIGVTGDNKEEIANVFLKSAPDNSRVLALESERHLLEQSINKSCNLSFINDTEDNINEKLEKLQPGFSNIVLFAKHICSELGIDEHVITEALSEYKFDNNVFSIKKLSEKVFSVNAFNANDVDSTHEIYNSIKIDYNDYKKIGIFCTRKDRPERTKSWIESLQKDPWDFDTVFVYGPHFNPINKRTYPFSIKKIEEKNFNEFFKRDEKKLFFGFGNYVQSGEKIVKVWNEMDGRT